MIVIVKTNTKKLQRKFSKLAKKIRNKRPMFKLIGLGLLNAIDKNFRTEGHEGVPWQRLSRTTVAARRKGIGAHDPKILQDTGVLRQSFVMTATNQLVRVGSPIEYSEQHEEGINLPQRKMLPSEEKALNIAILVTEGYIRRSIKESRL